MHVFSEQDAGGEGDVDFSNLFSAAAGEISSPKTQHRRAWVILSYQAGCYTASPERIWIRTMSEAIPFFLCFASCVI